MVKKIRIRKLFQTGALGLSFALAFIADIASSSACFFSWHEPDCPKELLR